MNTTNFYVELIVIGLGPFLCLLLLAGYVFSLEPNVLIAFASWGNFVMLLPIIYLLGIIVDRGADELFKFCWEHKICSKYFASEDDKHNARRPILVQSNKITELMEYGRSRMRICRGWVCNSVLLMIAFAVYGWRPICRLPGLYWIEFFLAILSLAAWFSWRSLAEADCKKVKQTSEAMTL